MKNKNEYYTGRDGVVRVKLTQGKIMLIDSGNWERLRHHRWCTLRGGKQYYAATNIPLPSGGQRFVSAH